MFLHSSWIWRLVWGLVPYTVWPGVVLCHIYTFWLYESTSGLILPHALPSSYPNKRSWRWFSDNKIEKDRLESGDLQGWPQLWCLQDHVHLPHGYTAHAASILPHDKAMKLMALGDAGDLQSPPGANHCNMDLGNSDLPTTAYSSMLLLRKQNSRDTFKMHFRFISHIQS